MNSRFVFGPTVLAFLLFSQSSLRPAAAQEDDPRDSVFQDVDAFSMAIQEARAAEVEPAYSSADKDVEEKSYRADLGEYLLPGGQTRFWRALKFTLSYQDQPDKAVNVTGMAPTQMLEVVPNPETRLRQLGVTLSPAQWFRSAADFKAAYDLAAGKATRGYIDASGPRDPLESLAGSDLGDKLDFLAWTGGDRLVRRVALGLSITVSRSDRKRTVGTPEFPDSGDDTTWTFKFDPDALTVFPGDLAAAYAALQAHTGLSHDRLARLEQGTTPVCGETGNPIDCLNSLTGRKVKGRWLAGLIPTFEYKRESQFEFRSVNDTFVPSADIEDTLDTVTVTWDLGAALDTAKHRRDAVAAIAIHKQLVLQDKMRTEKDLTISAEGAASVTEGDVLYYPVKAWYVDKKAMIKERAEGVSWNAHVGAGDKGTPLKDLKLTLTGDGTLVGKPDRAANGRTVTVTVTDMYKKSASYQVRLSIT